MRLSTALTLTLVALLLVSPVGVIGASSAFATSSAPAAADSQSQVHVQSQQVLTPDDPQQVITIRLTADGNAEWTIESRYLLEDEDEVETFRTFADAVIAGERDIDYDRETFEHFRWSAQNGVDRQMELRNASWDEPRVENRSEIALETDRETDTNTDLDIDDDTRIGIVSYSFTWTNFTEKDGNRIHLGDVFEQDDSTWFPRLADSQRLVIVSPSNYGYEQVARAPIDGKLVWNGPYEFDEDELSVTYLEGAPVETETPEEETPIPSRTTLGFGLLVLFGIVGAGGFFILNRSSTDTDGADGIGGVEAKAAEPSADGVSETEMETVNGAATTGTTDVTGTETTTTYDETDDNSDVDNDDVDLELLSDEERVHRLLRQNGGRMKQASIVKETGWSNAKVSQLLSKMDDDEEIEKLRIGRENLITHPEVDPTEID